MHHVNSKDLPIVNWACLCPGLQQVVGLTLALKDIAYIVANISKRIFFEIRNFRSDPSHQKRDFRYCNNAHRQAYVEELINHLQLATPLLGTWVAFNHLKRNGFHFKA